MRGVNAKRVVGSCLVLLLSACTGGRQMVAHEAKEPSGSPVPPRSRIVPKVEHHQHLVGPMLLSEPAQPLPEVELPPELAGVLRERERISGRGGAADLYTKDALVIDLTQDTWLRGPGSAERIVGAYARGSKFFPNAYGVDGSTAWIAGYIRDTPEDMHFLFGLERDEAGEWRIAAEYATNRPPPLFDQPITAERLIALLDDAGIERAVVHSVAYWLASPLDPPVENEQAKLRAANDWTVEQVRRYPDRLVAFCSVNPLKDYAIDELTRCAKLEGVKGIKLHFGNSGVDVKKPEHVATVRRFFEAANAQRMAIMVHLWTLDPSYGAEHSKIFLEQLLPAAPDVTVQIAHLAGAGRYAHDDAMAVFADACSAGDPRMKNVYFDLTTVVEETTSDETLALIAQRLRQVGLGRILFGSDTPVASRPPPQLAWSVTRRKLPLTDEEIRTIADNVAPYLR